VTIDPSAPTAAEPVRAAAPGLAAGQTLGKYRLDRVLGSGGMGIVWAAFDPDLERPVAIKLLHAANNDPTLRSRLLREARAMARLKHPNVLTVYEVGTDRNRDYIAMELVDGDSLEGWLASRPPRAQILAALLAAGRGLAAAHAAGLVHRDFKPHNVLRSHDGHVYVTDFGLARGHIEDGAEVQQVPVPALPDELASGSQPRRALDSVLDSPLTQTGVLIGTPAYMAPEQFAGRVPDPRTDQFAFCVTAWEALVGARPFRGASLQELEVAAGQGVATLTADLPARLRAVITRGLAPSPDARWPDMPALLRAFEDAIAPPRGRRLAWGLGLAGAVLAASGALFAFTSRGASEDDCEPAEQAFASAWSPARRSAVLQIRSGGEVIGATALLDEVRQRWIRSYTRTCDAPRSAERRQQLRCLREARDSIATQTERLLDRSYKLSFTQLAPIATALVGCDGEEGLPFFSESPEIPDVPRVRPVPPVPPLPPKP